MHCISPEPGLLLLDVTGYVSDICDACDIVTRQPANRSEPPERRACAVHSQMAAVATWRDCEPLRVRTVCAQVGDPKNFEDAMAPLP